jgi:hypothetical protein
MSAQRLNRLAAGARALAALLFAIAGSRFATVSVALALDEPPDPGVKEVRQSPLNVLKRPKLRPTDGHLGAAPSVFIRQHAVDLAPSASARPESARVNLIVTAGPPRSLVYVRGRQVGKTPFVGEVVCVSGDPVKIEVVPPKGMPLSSEQPCYAGATLRMGD